MFEDFAGVDDLSIDETVQGAAAVAEAFQRRITTPRGGCSYDARYVCFDLAVYQSQAMTARDLDDLRADVERCVRAEVRLDAEATTVDVLWYPEQHVLLVVVAGVTVDGGAFTLEASVAPDEGVVVALNA